MKLAGALLLRLGLVDDFLLRRLQRENLHETREYIVQYEIQNFIPLPSSISNNQNGKFEKQKYIKFIIKIRREQFYLFRIILSNSAVGYLMSNKLHKYVYHFSQY